MPRKTTKLSFATEAQAMSQDKGASCPSVVIIGAGPAGMIASLALCSFGLRVQVFEQFDEEAVNFPKLESEAASPDEPLVFSEKSLKLLRSWGLQKEKDPAQTDLGPNARSIPFKDLRTMHGRLLRREALDAETLCIRASDLCKHIKESDCCKGSLEVNYNSKVLHYVDISWGAAVICSDGRKQAGDFLIGADGLNSTVRKHLVEGDSEDFLKPTGLMQWQGHYHDPNRHFPFFSESINLYLGKETYAMVYRLPDSVLNWSLTRPIHIESSNTLAEWKLLMRDWPVNEDGTVDIPVEQQMKLRDVFNLFDTDRSGSIDFEELKVAVRQEFSLQFREQASDSRTAQFLKIRSNSQTSVFMMPWPVTAI